MHFALTSEQELARNALRELLTEHCTATHLRKVFEAEAPTRIAGLWAKLHELGVIGALAPEAIGGLGLNAIDLAVLLEETGRAAVPDQVVETAAVAVPLLAALPDSPRAVDALRRVLAGELSIALAVQSPGSSTARNLAAPGGEPRAPGDARPDAAAARKHPAPNTPGDAFAGNGTARNPNGDPRAPGDAIPGSGVGVDISVRSGERQFVAGDALAGLILCEHGGEVHLLDVPRLALTPLDTVDRARRLYALDVAASVSSETCLTLGSDAQQLWAAAQDHATLGTAAQLVGLGQRMLELTITHVKTRKQFGQAIGVFQAVKHQLVDARLALEFASPLVYRAAHSLAHNDPQRSLHVSMAKAFASEAAWLAARKALQLHGAIGYSYEYELQLYMKRAWALAAAHGDAREHRRRIADVLLTAQVQGESHA